jgi:hypothetical protein
VKNDYMMGATRNPVTKGNTTEYGRNLQLAFHISGAATRI